MTRIVWDLGGAEQAMSWWAESLGGGSRSDNRLTLKSTGLKASWLPAPELEVPQGGYLIPNTPEGIRFAQLVRAGAERAQVVRTAELARMMLEGLDTYE